MSADLEWHDRGVDNAHVRGIVHLEVGIHHTCRASMRQHITYVMKAQGKDAPPKSRRIIDAVPIWCETDAKPPLGEVIQFFQASSDPPFASLGT